MALLKYQPEEVDAALIELALANGSCALGEARLKARGVNIPASTLRSWRERTYVERYHEIKARIAPMVEAEIVRQARGNARLAAEVAEEALRATRVAIAAGDIDPAKAFQQISIGLGIHVEKTLLLEGRPTEIHETRDTQTLLEDLKRIAPSLVVDGTAVEVAPLELSR